MNILLTGPRGFVGSRVLAHLHAAGHTVKCIRSEELRGPLTEKHYDALARQFAQFRPDAVIHTAAISDTEYAEHHPEESRLANVLLPEAMARLASQFGCRLVSCSSDQVYNGAPDILAHHEDEPCAPVSVYGRHKLEAEQRIAAICPDAVSLRLTWMYDFPAYRRHTNMGFPLQLLRAAAENQVLQFSTSDFRGFTYVRSVAANIEKAISLPGGVYNFGSENDLNTYQTALVFLRAFGLRSRAAELILPKEGTTRSLAMDCSLLKSHGITFETTAEGPLRMVEDYWHTRL